MTKAEVVAQMRIKIPAERKLTTEILLLINAAEDFKVYLELGHSTMHRWLTREFKYSHGAASRRISAAEQLRVVPTIEGKMVSGDLNLSTVCQTRMAVRSYEKITNEKVSAEDQADLLSHMENKTSDEAQKILFEAFPETSDVRPESQRRVSENLTRHTLYLNDEAQANFEWVRDFMSHAIPEREAGLILTRLCLDFRTRQEKKDERAVQRENAKRTHSATFSRGADTGRTPSGDPIKSAHIKWQEDQSNNTQFTTHGATAAVDRCVKSRVKRVSLVRAQRGCEFKNPETGEPCGEKAWIESDHINPKALGGSDELQNRRALCRAHNQFEAKQKLRNLYYYKPRD